MPRALTSTKQEMAPPERHHKGILCGRALRGSSNAAPSTAQQRGTTNGWQQRGSKNSWAPTNCSSGTPPMQQRGSKDRAGQKHQELCKQTAPPAPQRDPLLLLLINTALLGAQTNCSSAQSQAGPRHDPPARWTPRMHPAGQKRQELCHTQEMALQRGEMLHHQRTSVAPPTAPAAKTKTNCSSGAPS